MELSPFRLGILKRSINLLICSMLPPGSAWMIKISSDNAASNSFLGQTTLSSDAVDVSQTGKAEVSVRFPSVSASQPAVESSRWRSSAAKLHYSVDSVMRVKV